MDIVDQSKLYKYCPHCSNPLTSKDIDNQRVKACSNCGFIFWNNPKPVVSMVITKGAKILMVQRARKPLEDYWCLPGGFVDISETPEESIRREIKEELSVQSKVEGLVGIYRIDNDPRGIHIDIIYRGTIAKEPSISEEHKQISFFDITSLPEKVAYKHREAILDWFKNNSSNG